MSQATDGNLIPSKGQAGADPHSIPLAKIDVSDSELFETDTLWGYFERLRKEEPVHYCAESDFGAYWSVTRYEDIATVEKNPDIFSSARSIVVGDPDRLPSSISRLRPRGRRAHLYEGSEHQRLYQEHQEHQEQIEEGR